MQRLKLFRSAEKKYLITVCRDPAHSTIGCHNNECQESRILIKTFSSKGRPFDPDKDSERCQQLIDQCFAKNPPANYDCVYGLVKQVAHILKVNEPVKCEIILNHVLGEESKSEGLTLQPVDSSKSIQFASHTDEIDKTCNFQAMPRPKTDQENDLEYTARCLNTPHDFFQEKLAKDDGVKTVQSCPKIDFEKQAAEVLDESSQKQVEYRGEAPEKKLANDVAAPAAIYSKMSAAFLDSCDGFDHISDDVKKPPSAEAKTPNNNSRDFEHYNKLTAKLLLNSRKPNKRRSRLDMNRKSREDQNTPTTEKIQWLFSQTTDTDSRETDSCNHKPMRPVETVMQELGKLGVPGTSKGGLKDKDKTVEILRRPDWPRDKPEMEMAYRKTEATTPHDPSGSLYQAYNNWHAYEPRGWHWNARDSNWQGWTPNNTPTSCADPVCERTLDPYHDFITPHQMYWNSLQASDGHHSGDTNESKEPSLLPSQVAADKEKMHSKSFHASKHPEKATLMKASNARKSFEKPLRVGARLFSKSFDETNKTVMKKELNGPKMQKDLKEPRILAAGVVYSKTTGGTAKSGKTSWKKYSDPIIPFQDNALSLTERVSDPNTEQTPASKEFKTNMFMKPVAPIVVDKVYTKPCRADDIPTASAGKVAKREHTKKPEPVKYLSRELKYSKEQVLHQAQNLSLPEAQEADASVLLRAYHFLAKEIPKYTSMNGDSRFSKESKLRTKSELHQLESNAKSRANAIHFSRPVDHVEIKKTLCKEAEERIKKLKQSREEAMFSTKSSDSTSLDYVALTTKLPPPFQEKPKVSDVKREQRSLRKQPSKRDEKGPGKPVSPDRPHPASVSLIPPMSLKTDATPATEDAESKTVTLKELLERVRKRNKVVYCNQQLLASPSPQPNEYCGDKVPPCPPPCLPCEPKETKQKPCPPKDYPPMCPECPPPCPKPTPPKCADCPPRCPPPCPPPAPKSPPPCPPPPPKCPDPPSPPPPPKCPPPCPPPPPKCPPPPPKCPPPTPKPCDPCKKILGVSPTAKMTVLQYLASKHRVKAAMSGGSFDEADLKTQALLRGVIVVIVMALRELYLGTMRRRLHAVQVDLGEGMAASKDTLNTDAEIAASVETQSTDLDEDVPKEPLKSTNLGEDVPKEPLISTNLGEVVPREVSCRSQTVSCLRSKDYNPWVPIPSHPVKEKPVERGPLDCLKRGERPPVCTTAEIGCKVPNLPCPSGYDKSCSGFPKLH